MEYESKKFKSGGLYEKHAVANWSLESHLSTRLWTQGNQEKLVPRWPVAGPSGYWLLASNPATKVCKIWYEVIYDVVFIYRNWVFARWQWSVNSYKNMEGHHSVLRNVRNWIQEGVIFQKVSFLIKVTVINPDLRSVSQSAV